MRVTITTQSTGTMAEAFLPLAMVKQGIRVRHTHEDAKITGLRNAAIVKCEAYARIAILQKTITLQFRGNHHEGDVYHVSRRLVDLDRVQNGIKLPYPLVSALVSLNGLERRHRTPHLVNARHYMLEDNRWLRWKDQHVHRFDNYILVYTSGYALMPDSLDKDALRQAVIDTVQDAYDNPGQSTDLPRNVKQALKPYWNSPLQS